MKKRIIFLICVLLLMNISSLPAQESSRGNSLPQIIFFYLPNCHPCQKVKNEIMPAIEKEFSGIITIKYLDTDDISNYKLMLALKKHYNCDKKGVPTVFVGGNILVGYDQIKTELRENIISALKKGMPDKLDKLPGIDLIKHFLSFGALAILIAGLVDGVNPCAFTVIVFFISFLTFQGYKRRELIVIGLCFILAVFLTYVLIGLGIFRSLYTLNKFYLVTRIVYYVIAALSFILGIFALYDLWLFVRKRKTEGMILQLPQTIKNRIHSIIGMHYRKSKETAVPGANRRHIFQLILSALITGFLVSLLEAVCTGQLYLPTITFVLKEATLRVRALGYLLLYNFMFIIPLFLVFLFALLGTTSEGFARFMQKHMGLVKLFMALLFFGLGVFILIGA